MKRCFTEVQRVNKHEKPLASKNSEGKIKTRYYYSASISLATGKKKSEVIPNVGEDEEK